MERERIVKTLAIVMTVGVILTTVGMFIASGVDQGGTAYYTLYTTSMTLVVLVMLVAGYWHEHFEDEQNQSQEEHDSSLL